MTAIWRLFKERGPGRLSEESWESLVKEGDRGVREWGKRGNAIGMLYRDMFMAASNYYEHVAWGSAPGR